MRFSLTTTSIPVLLLSRLRSAAISVKQILPPPAHLVASLALPDPAIASLLFQVRASLQQDIYAKGIPLTFSHLVVHLWPEVQSAVLGAQLGKGVAPNQALVVRISIVAQVLEQLRHLLDRKSTRLN